MKCLRPLRACAVCVLVVVTGLPGAPRAEASATTHVVDGHDDDWQNIATMVPGTAAYGSGEWAFTDYVYDDRGAGGAFAYPDGTTGNDADVAILQIAADDDAVRYLVRFNSMADGNSAVIALAVDTDCDEQTGGGPWPYGAGVETPGWEFVVTAWGLAAGVTTADGTGAVASSPNLHDNLIEFEVPRSMADPGTGVWCYRGGVGLWDSQDGGWVSMGTAAEPNVFNLLFRNRIYDGGTEATDENTSGGFQFAKQSAALSSGDLGPFVRRVDFGVLSSRATIRPVEPVGDHNFTRIYESSASPNALPEGVSSGTNAPTGSLYNGRYQPYILFVPASYWDGLGEPAPMFPMLHGWTGNHRSFNPSDNAFWNDVVRANRALVAKPLGRGEEVWYEHLGELDTLEVIADVQRHYVVDADRVYLAGTSMGGLGTIKIAEQHPDLFAGIFPSVPPMSDRAQGYALPANNDWDLAALAESLRNVPVRNFTGTYDALVPGGVDSERFCRRLRELTYDHDCWRDISPNGGHRGYENDRAAQVAQLLDEHPRRIVDPAHVTYQSHPVFRRQATQAGIEHLLDYDAAYWVSGIRWPDPPHDGGCDVSSCLSEPGVPTWPVDPGTPRRLASGEGISSIDVRTFGLGEGDPLAEEIPDDPSPTLIRNGIVLRPGPGTELRNAFTLAVSDVLAMDLDLARMGLSLASPLTASVSGAGTIELGLIADGEACMASLDGASVAAVRDGSRLVLEIPLTTETAQLAVTCS